MCDGSPDVAVAATDCTRRSVTGNTPPCGGTVPMTVLPLVRVQQVPFADVVIPCCCPSACTEIRLRLSRGANNTLLSTIGTLPVLVIKVACISPVSVDCITFPPHAIVVGTVLLMLD